MSLYSPHHNQIPTGVMCVFAVSMGLAAPLRCADTVLQRYITKDLI